MAIAALPIERGRVTASPPMQTHPTRREQTMLATEAHRGNADSRATMILRNQRLVQAIARKYTGHGLDLEDLVQEGIAGLIRAVDRFDPTRGVAFSTYATFWIRQTIQRAIERDGRVIRLPSHLVPAVAAMRQAAAETDGETIDAAAVEAIAQGTGISHDICTALAQTFRTPASLDAPVASDGDTALHELVSDPASYNPEVAAERHEVYERLHELITKLPARERDIIRARFGLDRAPETLEQIGARYGLSSERIRQIERQAIGRLRHIGAMTRLDLLARECDLL